MSDTEPESTAEREGIVDQQDAVLEQMEQSDTDPTDEDSPPD